MNYILIVSRFAAFLVDYIGLYLLIYLFSRLSSTGYLISLTIFFLYRLLTTAFFGATLGMMILKLRLSDYNLKICLKREIYRFASAFFYAGYIYALFNSKHQTFHDNAAQTNVIFGKKGSREKRGVEGKKIVYIISTIVLALSIIRWIPYIVLNDIGLIGLKKVYVSDEYYQSFEGDNLVSLSQDELYIKTLGRKYTTVIDIEGKPSLIRISNKLKYTEVYRLNLSENKVVGEYLYRVNMPLQFICSGNFRGGVDLCGVSPQNKIILVNGKGEIYGEESISLESVLTLRCGDMDKDGKDEAVILGRGGDVEIFRMQGQEFKKVYSGKIGEDILPKSFYIDGGMSVVGNAHNKKLLYNYEFKDNKFVFKSKRDFKIDEVSTIARFKDNIIISHVFRGNMTFKKGRTQLLEVYRLNGKIKRLYNFGARTGRSYAYMVRTLEDIIDIDGDGSEEIILKAVGKEDVMGQGYIVEIYRESRMGLVLNRVLSWIEEIMH